MPCNIACHSDVLLTSPIVSCNSSHPLLSVVRVGGSMASSSPENNLRQSAIVILFNRLTDRQNFHLLVDTLPLHAHSALYSKIGFLNCIDIMNIDIRFELFELGECFCVHSSLLPY